MGLLVWELIGVAWAMSDVTRSNGLFLEGIGADVALSDGGRIMTKKEQIAYWILTALFLLPMAGSGIPELIVGGPAAAAASTVHLGYPLYLMRILGLAKILGAVAIVTNRSRTLAEWAYAGFVFDLICAVASHLIVGDGAFAVVPAIVLAIVLASYRLYSRRVGTSYAR